MDKFSFWQKWFWVGVVVAALSGPAGLFYSFALLIEPEHRKEGLALAIWSIIWSVAVLVLIWGIKK